LWRIQSGKKKKGKKHGDFRFEKFLTPLIFSIEKTLFNLYHPSIIIIIFHQSRNHSWDLEKMDLNFILV